MPLQTLDRDADTRPDGFISGVASSETIDVYGHLVKAGAFDASIRKRRISGPGGVKLLAFHDAHGPQGRITKLHTQGGELRIEAELNLDIGYVRDLHSAIRHSGGLSFSVGFALDEFDLGDDPKAVAHCEDRRSPGNQRRDLPRLRERDDGSRQVQSSRRIARRAACPRPVRASRGRGSARDLRPWLNASLEIGSSAA